MKRRTALLCAHFLLILAATSASAVTIDWTTVGDPGNPVDPLNNRYGRVDDVYNMSKYEVTNAQYTEFLNAKDPAGTNSLSLYVFITGSTKSIDLNSTAAPGSKYAVIAGKENKPVAFISWLSAARFVNWLNNGQGNGDTETGAYTMTPSDPFALGVVRNPGAKIFLPTADEWYKAAYYDPTTQTYFKYATSSSTPPIPVPPPGGPNSANFLSAVGQVTDVGAYTFSSSPYGTFDQSGNLYEWMETSLPSKTRLTGGGGYHSPDFFLSPLIFPHDFDASYLHDDVGFRVASVPEPSAFCSLCGGIACCCCFSLRARPKTLECRDCFANPRAGKSLPETKGLRRSVCPRLTAGLGETRLRNAPRPSGSPSARRD